jgi:hypothetical protein
MNVLIFRAPYIVFMKPVYELGLDLDFALPRAPSDSSLIDRQVIYPNGNLVAPSPTML